DRGGALTWSGVPDSSVLPVRARSGDRQPVLAARPEQGEPGGVRDERVDEDDERERPLQDAVLHRPEDDRGDPVTDAGDPPLWPPADASDDHEAQPRERSARYQDEEQPRACADQPPGGGRVRSPTPVS